MSMTGTQTANDPVPAMRMGPLPQYDPDLSYGSPAADPDRHADSHRCANWDPHSDCTSEGACAPALPRKPALLRVTAGRGFAAATVRITRDSVIRGQLLRRGGRVLGTGRVVGRAGTHVVRVSIKRKFRRQLRRRGSERVTLTLRIAVVARSKATHVFSTRVRVRV